MYCEEEMREKMRWVRGDVCVCGGREEKGKAGGIWVVGKKKRNKKEKGNGE